MNLREAAQQALEALEEMWQSDKAQSAITALRAALAEPQTTHWEGCEAVHPECRKTKPVAWVEPKWLDPYTRGWPSDSFASQPIEGWLPLYTALTPRKPLTNEEILDMSDATDSGDYWHLRFARAIEKAHGIGEQHA